MKKLKLIPFILIAIAFIATSCAIDDDDPVIGKTIITKTVSLQGTQIIVPSSTTPYDLAVYVDQSFGSPALVEYTVNGVEAGGTIPFGSASGSLPIDVSENGSVLKVTLTNVSVLNKPNDVKAVIDQDSKTIEIVVVDGLPAPNPDNIELVFLNSDEEANIWFGLSQFTTDGTWVTDFNQNSNGDYPRKMSIPLDGNGNIGAIPNSADVAPDVISLNLYPQAAISDPMGYTILVVFPDGDVQVLSGDISSGLFTDNAIIKVVVTDDTANPSLKSYEFMNF